MKNMDQPDSTRNPNDPTQPNPTHPFYHVYEHLPQNFPFFLKDTMKNLLITRVYVWGLWDDISIERDSRHS